jgi:hypothetical protein
LFLHFASIGLSRVVGVVHHEGLYSDKIDLDPRPFELWLGHLVSQRAVSETNLPRQAVIGVSFVALSTLEELFGRYGNFLDVVKRLWDIQGVELRR